MNKLARKVALVGAGMCKFGRNFPLQRNPDMWVEAWLNAVKTVDNGIEPKDIDLKILTRAMSVIILQIYLTIKDI
jgi:hypothetical protein